MRKILAILLIISGIPGHLDAQVNLVPNPSFEQFDTCPSQNSQIRFAIPWFQPNGPSNPLLGSTDYFNSCSTGSNGVPNNGFGVQNARTGSAYIGESIFEGAGQPDEDQWREYSEVRLNDSLLFAKKYCVSFYVSLAEGAGINSSDFQAYFSHDSLLYTDPYYNYIPVTPQFSYSGASVTDITNWSLIKGVVNGNGGEQFITIGNFLPGAQSNYSCQNSSCLAAYYYIDDVSVVELPDLSAGSDSMIISGNSVQLNGSCSQNWPGMTYEWLPHSSLSDPYSLNPTATPTTTITYTLTVSCASCNVPCLSDISDSVTISIDGLHAEQKTSFQIQTLYHSNELFFINSLQPETSINISDMNGRLLYTNKNYSNDLSLNLLSEGTYVYWITLRSGETSIGKFTVVE